MANHRRGQTYLGVTNNLTRRAWQHRAGTVKVTKQKGCTSPVWFEQFADLQEARACAHRVKKWHPAWKLRLIEERNPGWRDLYCALNA